jgi:NAD(P)-dependent dehydrogenase (short-subunit alcohol dehydrogenase family)
MGDNMRLKGKVALLTGAAAAIKGELMGFGGAVAHLFVREGAKVVLTDIRDDLGERAAAALRADGHDARYMHLDVTSEENWANVVDAVMDTHGRLDILFNNAGVGFPRKVEDITVAIWERELDVHAKGVFLGTRSAIPAMRKGGGGSIVNTSSVWALSAVPPRLPIRLPRARLPSSPSPRHCNMRRKISASTRYTPAMPIHR